MIDGSLRGAEAFGRFGSWKAATENNTGSLGRDRDMLAKITAGHFEHRCLATAGSSGQHYQLCDVPCLFAVAGMRAGWQIVGQVLQTYS